MYEIGQPDWYQHGFGVRPPQGYGAPHYPSNRNYQNGNRGRPNNFWRRQRQQGNRNFNGEGKGRYNCDPCDKHFKDEQSYQSHISEHEVCGREGCTFTAHSKIIAKHVEMQHITGLFKKIKTDNPEDVKKWIDERKRRYPTKVNIETKKKAKGEMEKRGERIHDRKQRFNPDFKNNQKRNSKFDRNHRKNNNSRNRKTHQRRRNQGNDKVGKDVVKTENSGFFEMKTETKFDEEEELEKGGVVAFRGINHADSDVEEKVNEEANNFSDTEWIENCSEIKLVQPVISHSLSMLSALYNSYSEEEEEEEEVATKNDEAPEEVKTLVTLEKQNTQEVKSNSPIIEKRVRKRKHSKPERKYEVPKRRRNLSLLEKLLSAEIKHERNIILQCVRHVVERNFFDS